MIDRLALIDGSALVDATRAADSHITTGIRNTALTAVKFETDGKLGVIACILVIGNQAFKAFRFWQLHLLHRGIGDGYFKHAALTGCLQAPIHPFMHRRCRCDREFLLHKWALQRGAIRIIDGDAAHVDAKGCCGIELKRERLGGGAALAATGSAELATLIGTSLESVLHVAVTEATVASIANIGTVALASLATFGGALLGSTIGIDRYYIRKWFDHTEGVVHGSHHKESALIERSAQIARLKSAAKADERTKMQLDSGNAERPASLAISEPAPSDPEQQTPIASLSKAANDDIPSTKIKASEATLQRRLADIQRAMANL